jgi:hypothetical protein
MRALAQAYAQWTSYGLLGLADFPLHVVGVGSVPVGSGQIWTERRRSGAGLASFARCQRLEGTIARTIRAVAMCSSG